jgi:hypothetical protein
VVVLVVVGAAVVVVEVAGEGDTPIIVTPSVIVAPSISIGIIHLVQYLSKQYSFKTYYGSYQVIATVSALTYHLPL